MKIQLDTKIKIMKFWKDSKDFMLVLFLLNLLITTLQGKNEFLGTILEEFDQKTTTIVINAQKRIIEPVKAEQAQLTGIFSAYNAEVGQTDSNPLIMANGQKVFDGAIANNCLDFGTKVEVNGKIYVVSDRMNKRYDCTHFDIYMNSKVEALKFGRKSINYKLYE